MLKEYAQYVEQVRTSAKSMPFAEAVEESVDYCIQNDILADFLTKNRAEAIAMSILEYSEEEHMEIVREEGREEGEDKAFRLFKKLTDDGKREDLERAFNDREYREKLYQENGL